MANFAQLRLISPILPYFVILPNFGFHTGEVGDYQQTLKQVQLSYVEKPKCQELLRKTKLGEKFRLDESFNCAGKYLIVIISDD